MWWRVALACLAVVVISLPGHLILDRLWALAFRRPLAAMFRGHRRTAALQAMWLDFFNMCATVFLALLCGLLILGRDASARWILVGFAALTSALMVTLVSSREPTEAQTSAALATPMMMAGSLVAILLGAIIILARG